MIFLSHANEDKEAARRLFRDLSKAGFSPWLDEESLIAGQDWQQAISEAIRQSQYFLFLVSNHSIDKIGVVQRELKEAEDQMLKIPDDGVFIIPVRLADCELPTDKLKSRHQVDLFPDWDDGIKQLVKSISLHQRKERSKHRAAEIAKRPKPLRDIANSYFFYISQDKLDKLEKTEREPPHAKHPTVQNVVAHITTDRGNNDGYRDASLRLVEALQRFGSDECIQNFNSGLPKEEAAEGWAYAELKLSIEKRQGELLILSGNLGRMTVNLSCSLRSFLDYDTSKNDVVTTSTNHWFFGGGQGYLFKTHFVILAIDKERKNIMGSPLYLSLPIGILEAT